MAKGATFGNQQVSDTKETGPTVLKKDMESIHGKTAIDSVVISSKVNEKDMADTSLLREENLRANIPMMRKTVLAFSHVNKEANTKEVSKTDIDMAMAL